MDNKEEKTVNQTQPEPSQVFENELLPDFPKGQMLPITLKLLAICFAVALVVAGVFALTKDKIAENEKAEEMSAVQSVFPDMDKLTAIDNAEGVNSFSEVKKNGEVIGYYANVSPNGFGGAIVLAVGLEPDGKLAGVKVISHSETPGLGSRVAEDNFLSQYEGKSGTLTINKDIDAITGSTVSSKAVTEGVNTAIKAYEAYKGGAANE